MMLFLAPLALQAQDERIATSPNGQLAIHIFATLPEGALWGRIGYQVWYRGKPLLTTSWMGLDIRDQEPFLGENPGFMFSDAVSGGEFNSVVAHYMQNGSLGRRIDIELRAYNDGVAFRYSMPRSNPLFDIYIREEMTEFNFAQPSVLAHLPSRPDYDLPFTVEQPGVGPVTITDAGPEARSAKYPRTYLVRTDTGMRTTLARSKTDPSVGYAGHTPLDWMWRAVIVGMAREHLAESATLKDLNR
ncbi:MAG TPA: glycoside hydrolase family 97 N-terminal domain-containing protein [Bryobacteraceae bacterium]|jgi:alpha-glucosidase|nr:glycoside hydrolase family 97 N-terminal domain-containing protein [Bryobacteraceae bacterium]